MNEHVVHLVLEGLGILSGCEVAVFLAPATPGGGQSGDRLTGRALGPGHLAAVGVQDRVALFVVQGNARLAEVLGDDDVGGDLRPSGGDLGSLHLEHDRAVGIGDAAVALLPLDGGERILARGGEPPLDLQSLGHRRHSSFFSAGEAPSASLIHSYKMWWWGSSWTTASCGARTAIIITSM